MASESKLKHFNGPTYEHDASTGLSRFTLSTYDDTETNKYNDVQLHGLLSELPEFSFTMNYDKGPGAEWQDTLQNFMANDLVASFNALGAKSLSFKNIVTGGTWTKMVYNGYTTPTIPLKFRIYSTDTLGQTPASVWLTNLKKYATLNRGNQFNLKDAGLNIITALVNAYSTGQETGAAANNIAEIYYKKDNRNNETTEQTDDDRAQQNTNKVIEQKNKLNQLLANAMAKFNIMSTTSGETDATIKDQIIKSLHIDVDHDNGLTGIGHDEKLYFKYECIGLNNKSIVPADKKGVLVGNQASFSWGSTNPDDIKIDFAAFRNEIENVILKKNKKFNVVFDESFFDEVEAIENNTYAIKDEDKNDKKLRKILLEFSKVAEDDIIGKYGEYRVYQRMNKSNSLGEKLWHLNIYNDVIFKSNTPLIVYISEWSVKHSDEIIHDEPVYYDFEITCALDQTYSRDAWIRHLADNDKIL